MDEDTKNVIKALTEKLEKEILGGADIFAELIRDVGKMINNRMNDLENRMNDLENRIKDLEKYCHLLSQAP